MKITWINFLHFYQPQTVDKETIIEATEKSYLRIINALKRNPNIRFTVNITGCLLDKWQELGFKNLINDIKKLVNLNQIELTGSAAFHSILPLLPKEEVERQIKLNNKILHKYFGDDLKLSGFFIPEATYDKKIAKFIKKMGFKWIILDEISATGKLNNINFTTLYQDKNSKLKVFFCSRKYSKSYVPKSIFKLINKKESKIIATATDAELYGLRHEDVSATFEKLLKRPEINSITISEFLDSLRQEEKIKPVASSWDSTFEELAQNNPYHLWHDKKNKIQVKLWQLANLAIKTVNKYKNDVNYQWARCHLDKGLSSCTFWWASASDFRLFGPISWSPDEIERGTNELIRSIRALDDATTRKTKIKAEKLYLKIKKMIWQKHWKYYWKKT
jgi:predicted glycosyl hydrolase (DUF1957 family)